MLYYLFDLDDTIVIHPPNRNDDMYDLKPDPCLQNLLNNLSRSNYWLFVNWQMNKACKN